MPAVQELPVAQDQPVHRHPRHAGQERHHRRCRVGPGNQHATVPARHRRVWLGSAFGGARGRTDVPKIVDWYMDGKIRIDELITHRLALEDINEGFALMKRGESIRSVVMY
jgi:Zn-dependent alcohol dehydrogenase